MRERREQRWVVWVVAGSLASIAALVLVWAPAPRTSSAPSESAPPAVNDPAPVATEDEPAPAEPAHAAPPAPVPPLVSAAAPAGCPEDEPDPPAFVRPSVWDLLSLHVQELNARLPQLSRDASPELRAGLRELHEDDARAAVDRLTGAPDRVRDGFDVALAGTLHAGSRALSRGQLRDAQHLARAAVREAPTDPLAHAFSALVHDRLDDPARARSAMTRAFALAPDEPALALSSARIHAEIAHFEEALAAVDAYLAEHPEDLRIASWRRRMAVRRELTSGHARRSIAGLELSWARAEVPSARIDEVVQALREALEEVARLTHRPRRAELAVVIYSDAEAMRRATCAPSWTGAVYDGVLHLDAQVIARDGPGWRRVVRHEGTHAQLSRVRGSIPTWLNEGLAQWMEGPPAERARAAWARMVRDRFWIPFASLEGELLVIDDPNDASLAYHQSLAMVLYLIEQRGERAVADAATLVEAGRSEDLLEAVVGRPVTGELLLAFLARAR